MSHKKLGIIAGGGQLPAQLIKTCSEQGRPFFVLGLEGHADEHLLKAHPHKMLRLGAVGDALKTLKREKIEEVIMAGHVGRPTLSSLRPDITATMLIAKLGTHIFSGDDALLSAIVKIMEEEGFTVVGVGDVCSHLLAHQGVLGKNKPTKQQYNDIAQAMKITKALGSLDIGQAIIIENGYVLGVEAAEGTEALITRCSMLPQHERGQGILVKCKKPTQDIRADLPTIGPDTIAQAYRAGLSGIVVEAGYSLILDQEKALQLANQYKIFVVGTHHEAA